MKLIIEMDEPFGMQLKGETVEIVGGRTIVKPTDDEGDWITSAGRAKITFRGLEAVEGDTHG